MSKPPFKAKPGQVDYSHIRWAPVINCVVKFKDKILLVKRSPDLRFYPGYWSGISGFLDDNKSLEEKVREELEEELGLEAKYIKEIKLGEIFDQEEPKFNKTWIVHPVLVELKDVDMDKISLDWENQDYVWIDWNQIKKFRLLPDFDKVLDNILSLLTNIHI